MKEAKEVLLSHKWSTLCGENKLNLIEKIVKIKTTLISTSFREYNSLYYTKDLEHSTRKNVLYTNNTGRSMINAQFSIGSTTNHKSCDNDRANINFDWGPYKSSKFLTKSNIG